MSAQRVELLGVVVMWAVVVDRGDGCGWRVLATYDEQTDAADAIGEWSWGPGDPYAYRVAAVVIEP